MTGAPAGDDGPCLIYRDQAGRIRALVMWDAPAATRISWEAHHGGWTRHEHEVKEASEILQREGTWWDHAKLTKMPATEQALMPADSLANLLSNQEARLPATVPAKKPAEEKPAWVQVGLF